LLGLSLKSGKDERVPDNVSKSAIAWVCLRITEYKWNFNLPLAC